MLKQTIVDAVLTQALRMMEQSVRISSQVCRHLETTGASTPEQLWS